MSDLADSIPVREKGLAPSGKNPGIAVGNPEGSLRLRVDYDIPDLQGLTISASGGDDRLYRFAGNDYAEISVKCSNDS